MNKNKLEEIIEILTIMISVIKTNANCDMLPLFLHKELLRESEILTDISNFLKDECKPKKKAKSSKKEK